MPYTPPSQQSPASTHSNSPVISRSSSYHQDDVPRSPVSLRPQPPRSMSSASYLHRHRRSPSIPKADGAPPTPTEGSDPSVSATDFARSSSIRQSPPPVNNLRIPSGAVISPPDSSENSDGDENNPSERGRELQKNWDQLQQAVRSLPQQRDGSPEKEGVQYPTSASEPVSQTTSPTALTAQARKISHSRSSTETKIMLKPTFAESPANTTDDSDTDEGNPFKPSLVRKKSGELVKPALRPSSRRRYSSMPGTPTYSKSVHFNDSDNQTRHFLQVDKPIAVSAGTSPVESYDSETEFPFNNEEQGKPELQIKVANFPEESFSRKTRPVRVERIFLSSDKSTLVGVCAVQNISFQKLVVARFTLDYWKTTSEVVAEFNNDVRSPPSDGCDRFTFHIKLSDQANLDNKTLLLCVRYNVGGQEFWDNNDNTNFQIDFTKGIERKPANMSRLPNSPLGARPLSAIPRSRHTPPTSRSRQESADDDFASRFDSSSSYNFGSRNKIVDESGATIKLKPRTKRPSMMSANPPPQPNNGLGSRYDFGTSLSAALTTAQDNLGRRSGLMNGAAAVNTATKSQANAGYFGLVDRTGPVKVDAKTERPDAITTDRPAMGSDQYRDLVQKFCYFTSGSGSGSGKGTDSPQPNGHPSATPTHPKTPSVDGTDETASTSSSSSSSGTSSPIHELQASNDRVAYSPNRSPFISRSSSPGPATVRDLSLRSASPVSFGYPYHSHRDGYLSDTPTPTAIRG
ncbi:unnamed protein product [Zymoseptoria tritici ST99CH_1A5]|uniref:CBM21 domain-containing protein n=3 Tax=Zymoseptoria tritici TaxID=1047171 RepID=A0A1X7RME1_ZYMT9|nr:unnamed protein product [Zymoseptoria tritici ST99CH_3D7]SMR48360.1 unnamed protein product [Zymoseptoria tritici ST99CH_1E4]SMR49571.1 unnamed protein product [Zymoseptoria tritici ST99CH_3D1]SMY22269.1 unnamed protein product [Zymoseptoria tritici ST99CH_1A5]